MPIIGTFLAAYYFHIGKGGINNAYNTQMSLCVDCVEKRAVMMKQGKKVFEV
ncbi:hypothetical protein [Sporomusa ovata]|uniref:Uncharacterized protein n=1 Tax=Sporomusa ovata TaxID=2378 RepID=A0A0U1L027_9FIRM|nr:hypothetical protein [Sporomusa ovata]CQR73017.1 hypothetical protein SpAn4DRAFT_2249 [Sporomusa ovata]